MLLTIQQVAIGVELASGDSNTKMAWWREAKFGMFVHWGIYSVDGGEYKGQKLPNSAEWMMNRGKIPIAEYEKYAARFNPQQFDADAFVALAKDAGMKYLVITAKHHDGFSMFHSTCSPYNVVDATPFNRDVMKELALACREHGLRFGFYYSQAQDWHHPGGIGNNWDKSIKRVSNDEYVREKAVPEVRQLLTKYGPIGIFWWDTPRKMSEESFNSLHSLTRLQPGVITNDRLGKDYPGDHKTFERHIPSKAPAAGQDWEVCMPISGSWGYKKSDTDFKSAKTLIQNLADIASKGGNYLLNVSPTGEGTLLPQSIERLKIIGQWMKINGESIYGTTASPFGALEWGRCTKKEHAEGTTVYLHVFDWPEDQMLSIPGLQNEVKQAYLLADWKPLETSRNDAGTLISLPIEAPDKYNSVIVLHIAGAVEIVPDSLRLAPKGTIVLSAEAAYIHNNEAGAQAKVQERENYSNIGHWTDPEAWVEWSFKVDQRGKYEVSAEIALEKEKSRFQWGIPNYQEFAEVKSTGGYGKYVSLVLGELQIDQPGDLTLQIRPDAENWQPINLKQINLKLQKRAE